MSSNPYRLPRNVVPSRYELRLEPNLDSATFTGSERVQVEVLEESTEVTLNAADLVITNAELVGQDGTRLAAEVSYDAEHQRATLSLSEAAAPGAWVLECDFEGTLNDQLRGFYRSTFTDVEGNERVIATTQFESTDARRAFPCWDEPDLKAAFSVTLVVPDGLFAVSNAAETAREQADNGKIVVSFADTMVMSTYLVAFVVGPLEATDPVDVGGVPLRIVHPIGKGHLTEFALEVGAFCLEFLSDYYGIPYPGDKVDMIAIPDFAFGAMENLGAITYRESLLLIDPDSVSQPEKRRVVDVIAHELAHMWFGDLVTMKWWNGIWLNEAFASFMEMKATEAFKPEWNRWLSFAADPGAERFDAFDIDALRETRPVEFDVQSPEEADEMFDALTYGKGSAVLRMLEQFIGEEPFRQGVGAYLREHAHANTVTADLWTGLETATEHPVGEIMDTWILQGGYPLVDVEPVGDGYMLSQERFSYLGSEGEPTWKVPLVYRTSAGQASVVLDGPIEVAGEALVVNAGGHGFYRSNYPARHLNDLSGRLDELDSLERFVVLDDARAMVLAGKLDAPSFLDMAARYGTEREHATWVMLARGLRDINHILNAETQPAFEAFVRDTARPLLDELGFEPTLGESDNVRRLRGVLLELLGALGSDPDVISFCRASLDQYREEPGALDPEVFAASVRVVAGNGTPAQYDLFWELHRTAKTPQDENRFLFSLALFPDPDLARRTFEAILSGDIRAQNSAYLVYYLLGNTSVNDSVWDLLKESWDTLIGVTPPMLQRQIAAGLPNLWRHAADVQEFVDAHPIKPAVKRTRQAYEQLRVRAGLHEREAKRIDHYLRGT